MDWWIFKEGGPTSACLLGGCWGGVLFAVFRCQDMFKVFRGQSDLGIVRHQNANCNSPLMIFESFEPDHVSYVFLPHRIIRMEIERHDDIHAWEVVINTGRKIESSSRHVQGRANFLSIFRITGANKNRF